MVCTNTVNLTAALHKAILWPTECLLDVEQTGCRVCCPRQAPDACMSRALVPWRVTYSSISALQN